MADCFIGEIRMLPYPFSPAGWAYCDGQSIPVNQQQLLYSIISNIYGGNYTTFNLPNMQARAPVGQGQTRGGGLNYYPLGLSTGSDTVTLNSSSAPSHSHTVNAANVQPVAGTGAAGNLLAQGLNTGGRVPTITNYLSTSAPNVQLSPPGVGSAGTDTPAAHTNLQPYLALPFCICLEGAYPSRN